jgi:hypothetical protein
LEAAQVFTLMLDITLWDARVLLHLQAKQVKPGTSWIVVALKQKLAWEVGAQQIKRTTQQETMKEIKKLKLAA